MDKEIEKLKEGDVKIEEPVSPIVPPTHIKSREVTEKDVEEIAKLAPVLYGICNDKIGAYKGALSIHHSQINNTDPMNFWVTIERRIYLNPTITRHSNYLTDSREACMSFNMMPPKIVQRWHKIEVTYQTIMVDPEDSEKFKLSSVLSESLSGRAAFVFQHEFDHGEGKFIYEI